MWVEQCDKPPMPGNGKHTTYKNGDDWGMVYCCFRHAADTPPLEGLLILRCAIHDPLEGLQICKIKVAKICENEGSRIEFRGWMS